VIRIGEDSWRVIVGRGHSPEHACLYCESRNILISGDQILPTISSNVSVYPREPLANPLADWFESLQRLKRELDEEVLVLPSHGRPFRGAHIRLDELIDEHEDGLQKLRRLCRQPQRAVDVFPALFKSRITEKNLIMAAGEAIAHLNYLVQAGEMTCEQGHGGVKSYQMAR
jgi:glyoxylase-like metal-dependent hydrolase (beta-lactamase superfamily II)